MESKDTIRRIFNTLFLYKNDDGELDYRIATAGITAYRKLKSDLTGEFITEKIAIPEMPFHPTAILPLGEGFYQEISICVFYNTEHIIKMEEVTLQGQITIHSLFNSAKEIGNAFVVGKTYSEKKQKVSESLVFDVDGKKISIANKDNAYVIKDENDQDIRPDSAIGKEVIRLFVRKQLT